MGVDTEHYLQGLYWVSGTVCIKVNLIFTWWHQ